MLVCYRVTYEANYEVEVPDNATNEEIETLVKAQHDEGSKDDALWVQSDIITEGGDEVADW